MESTSTSTEPAEQEEAARAPVAIRSESIGRGLAIASSLVAVLGLAAELLKEALAWPSDAQQVGFFSMSYEGNLPTWYTVALLLSCAGMLLLSARGARARGERAAHWFGLAAGFSYISLDELVQLHEMASVLDLDGVFYFSWVIPAGVVVLLVGLTYIGFLRRLERSTRNRFLLAGALYVGGAVLCELPLGWWTERYGTDNLGYGLIDWVEETLEIVGLTVFAWALAAHLAVSRFSFTFASSKEAPT